MYVLKCFINYAKEEKWLTEMSKKGYELVNASFGYTFREITPEEATFRIDYRSFKTKVDFIDYCTLFEDSGWKHTCGSMCSGNQYFKKILKDSHDDIFSDSMSKAGRYKRVSKLSFTMAISYIPILVALFTTNIINLKVFINPKLLYYTPGLWNTSGLNFIGSFLFETPFALARGFIWLFFPLAILLYFYFALKASKLYKYTIEER